MSLNTYVCAAVCCTHISSYPAMAAIVGKPALNGLIVGAASATTKLGTLACCWHSPCSNKIEKNMTNVSAAYGVSIIVDSLVTSAFLMNVMPIQDTLVVAAAGQAGICASVCCCASTVFCCLNRNSDKEISCISLALKVMELKERCFGQAKENNTIHGQEFELDDMYFDIGFFISKDLGSSGLKVDYTVNPLSIMPTTNCKLNE